ncbi:hypothetical protein MKW94_000356 [Papaver nudicaule]|uniref:Uncharacterized protein n=1 Tax=Papaver nudicaule TaxID=74823 RepID=A0AA41S100_PAPNU|nr:hypothetical protein [Papaver nudicaule]
MATKQNISTIVFFFALLALQSMIVTAQMHSCFTMYRPYTPWVEGGFTCVGSLMRWRYSPTDDVEGDCIDWCKTFDANVGISCAQMNVDEDHKIYCACYEKCDPHEESAGPAFR